MQQQVDGQLLMDVQTQQLVDEMEEEEEEEAQQQVEEKLLVDGQTQQPVDKMDDEEEEEEEAQQPVEEKLVVEGQKPPQRIEGQNSFEAALQREAAIASGSLVRITDPNSKVSSVCGHCAAMITAQLLSDERHSAGNHGGWNDATHFNSEGAPWSVGFH